MKKMFTFTKLLFFSSVLTLGFAGRFPSFFSNGAIVTTNTADEWKANDGRNMPAASEEEQRSFVPMFDIQSRLLPNEYIRRNLNSNRRLVKKQRQNEENNNNSYQTSSTSSYEKPTTTTAPTTTTTTTYQRPTTTTTTTTTTTSSYAPPSTTANSAVEKETEEAVLPAVYSPTYTKQEDEGNNENVFRY